MIIFLDIDGVLNNLNSMKKGVHLLPHKALMINSLLEEFDARIVISSAWRGMPSLDLVLSMVGLKRVMHDMMGVTPHLREGRGAEIATYLEDFPGEGYVIIDDIVSDMLPEQEPYIVHTDTLLGITKKDIAKAREIMRRQYDDIHDLL